jgi:hypothetical protein
MFSDNTELHGFWAPLAEIATTLSIFAATCTWIEVDDFVWIPRAQMHLDGRPSAFWSSI